MLKSIGNKHNLIAVILCALSIFGMYSFLHIKVLGITLTAYRIAVPIMIVYYYLLIFYKQKNIIFQNYIEKKLTLSAMLVCAFWVIYGLVQVLLAEEINYKESIQEMYMLSLGFLIIAIMIALHLSGVKAKIFLYTVKVIYVALIIFSIYEIVTGNHLASSKLQEFLNEGDERCKYLSSTIFYNVNDYSAFLAIFLPVFFEGRNFGEKIFNLIMIFLSVSVLIKNDAWICFFAVAISLLIYIVLSYEKNNFKNNIINYIMMIITVFCGYKFGRKIFNSIELQSSVGDINQGTEDIIQGIEPPTEVTEPSISQVITSQLGENSVNSSGHIRIDTYCESISNMFADTFGLGYGPANFNQYLINSDNANLLINPHSLWVEILVQYGLIIFILFVGALLYLYICLVKIYLANRDKVVLCAISMDSAYVFASFAPSVFLTYPYHWILIGISIILVMKYHNVILRRLGDTKHGE